ncbi:hypothetical protein E2553_20080 [Paraburkholderia dipogonis]|uniref:PASTA domain-containing protein n=1 Tax=Paraburkholderia dipogonis TaxID=1211383 RepID=A0A4Y8MP12_9BURK|nr:hypothetical protein [Paraburkholderia dipogonis]TFE39164.1 hypothetical protein E2553_20080 [Paraburkholderia dipogonis]
MMHRAGCTAAAFAAAALVAACGGGGGGGGSSGGSAGAPPAPSSNASAYQNSMTLGSVGAVSLSLIAATTTVNAMLVSPVAAPLLVAGNNTLVSTHLATNVTGAGTACVSAPTNSIGTVSGVNAGVNIKSVAALLDNTWSVSATPSANWTTLGASGAVFDGWENCGAKAEGAPSPSSTLTVNADGSFSDNVFDGNPSTTVTTVNQSFTAAQAAALLSDAGYVDTSQPANPQTIRLRIYHNAAQQTVLVEQGIPASGATNQNPGFVAIYFPR